MKLLTLAGKRGWRRREKNTAYLSLAFERGWAGIKWGKLRAGRVGATDMRRRRNYCVRVSVDGAGLSRMEYVLCWKCNLPSVRNVRKIYANFSLDPSVACTHIPPRFSLLSPRFFHSCHSATPTSGNRKCDHCLGVSVCVMRACASMWVLMCVCVKALKWKYSEICE